MRHVLSLMLFSLKKEKEKQQTMQEGVVRLGPEASG